MSASRNALMVSGAALAGLALICAPLSATSRKFLVRTTPSALSFRMADGIGSFTPAAADARTAMSFNQAGLDSGSFRFTPSARPGSRRAVTVAIRARGSASSRSSLSQPSAGVALAPSAYNLGASVGWKRFAVTGEVARVQSGLLPIDREQADVGLSYSGTKWSTRLQLGAERAVGLRSKLVSPDEAYSVDLGGSYALSSRLAVTGGVRYKMQRDRLQMMSDERRDSQAVYIGTAFKF